MARELLTAAEVEREYGIKQARLYDLVRQNLIGGVVKLGRQVRFDRNKLEAWIDGGGQALPGGWRKEEAA